MDYLIHRFVESEELETQLDDCLREIVEERTVLVVLSIFLRFRGSPESKPVAAPHSKTGG